LAVHTQQTFCTWNCITRTNFKPKCLLKQPEIALYLTVLSLAFLSQSFIYFCCNTFPQTYYYYYFCCCCYYYLFMPSVYWYCWLGVCKKYSNFWVNHPTKLNVKMALSISLWYIYYCLYYYYIIYYYFCLQ